MNRQFGNKSIINNGQHYGDIYQFNGPVNVNPGANDKPNNSENLYRQKETLNIYIRLIITMIYSLIDFGMLCYRIMNGLISKWFDKLIRCIDNFASIDTLFFYLDLIVVILSVLLGVYLCCITFRLIVDGRYSSLRRVGKKVYRIMPSICPICKSKMTVKYNRGNYIVCNQEKVEHRWPIYFSYN